LKAGLLDKLRRQLRRGARRWIVSILQEESPGGETSPAGEQLPAQVQSVSKDLPDSQDENPGGPPEHWVNLVKDVAPELLRPRVSRNELSARQKQVSPQRQERSSASSIESKPESTPESPSDRRTKDSTAGESQKVERERTVPGTKVESSLDESSRTQSQVLSLSTKVGSEERLVMPKNDSDGAMAAEIFHSEKNNDAERQHRSEREQTTGSGRRVNDARTAGVEPQGDQRGYPGSSEDRNTPRDYEVQSQSYESFVIPEQTDVNASGKSPTVDLWPELPESSNIIGNQQDTTTHDPSAVAKVRETNFDRAEVQKYSPVVFRSRADNQSASIKPSERLQFEHHEDPWPELPDDSASRQPAYRAERFDAEHLRYLDLEQRGKRQWSE
jgi:hypothetical protein